MTVVSRITKKKKVRGYGSTVNFNLADIAGWCYDVVIAKRLSENRIKGAKLRLLLNNSSD